jgi:diguanylate cyclase (GGDEF)-like protein/PAS domain S-box-containing protein
MGTALPTLLSCRLVIGRVLCVLGCALAMTVTSAQAVQAPLRHPLEDQALIEPERVLRELVPLIAEAEATGAARERALLLLARANACRVLADLHCQREAGTQAREAAREIGDPKLEARGLILEGRAYMALQDYSQGERQLGEAELRLKDAPDPALSADIDLGYSSLSHSIGKHALAVEYADRGLARLVPGQESALQVRLLRNRARALIQLKRLDEADAALTQALGISLAVSDPKLRAELHLEQARLARQRGDRTAQLDNAAQVIELGETLRNSQLAGQGHEALGLSAMDARDLGEAQRQLEIAASNFRSHRLTRDELRALRSLLLVMLDAKRPGEEREPVTRRYLAIEAEVIQADRAQAADDFDARLKYAEQANDVLRLESEAALAKERERTLQAANRVNRLFNAAAIVVLLMLLGFYLLQRRSNRRLKQAMRAVRESESRATALLQLSTGYVFLHDLDGRVLMMNLAAAEALGSTPQALVGTDVRQFVPDDGRADFERYLERMRSVGKSEGTLKIKRTDGDERYWRYGNRLAEVDADSSYVVGHAVDVTQQREETATLRERSEHDALTGAWNRRYLDEFEQRNGADAHWAVVNVDLDHFKQINDTRGHEEGDRVLIGVTRFLQARVRETDAVVRAGGDEFLLLLPNIDAGALDALIARLQRDMPESPCALSLGWALREGREALADTLARADQAMYARRQRVRGATTS